ncbi:MAG: MmcQ/YjbR family DNA-binding protein [Candidatus Dormibacteraeota bacterium]|uniref:MmcQ/YjbR family DNA-binding protein n=1 Tax=Candidatus Dormiibacter inghamiae TaxID=3127013 RepID=A0A934NB99_9BACT|nr:MmcQ/YjbR family DNA-binding protein [Candidatus Dormibacteraeota bacterium]MBJ7607560.1 MmcQ/YjbR family DNA-binding protein [Candidatus Dormibacteraeota bacterium]
MLSPGQARRIALGFPGTAEQDHHGFPSFRVNGRIFATLPDPGHLNVMLDANQTLWSVQHHPDTCEELWWGKRLSGVRVDLGLAGRGIIRELLSEAWRRRAPSQLGD